MSDNEFRIDGFAFQNIEDYKEAKHEAETIEYIKANNELEDYNKTVKLYYKLVEQNTLRTAIGLAFLLELQDRIVKEGIISKENIAAIRGDKAITGQKTFFKKEQNKSGSITDVITDYKIKLRNSRIISLFLAVIIIIMILIAIFSDRSVYTNYQEKILNKYSAWEQDLNAREMALQENEN
jgi:hypothetical protein